MTSIRLVDSPYRSAAVYYTACLMTLALTTSMCVVLTQTAMLAASELGIVNGDWMIWPDVILRVELLGVFGAGGEMHYRFHRLARAGLVINSQLVAAALFRALGLYFVLASAASLGWMAGKYFSGHGNWWPLAWSFGAHWLMRSAVYTLLRYEAPVATGGRGVLTMEDAAQFGGGR